MSLLYIYGEESIKKKSRITIKNFIESSYIPRETLKKLLSFNDCINFIQEEYKKYLIKEKQKFYLYVKFWNFMITFLYDNMKKSKMKKSSQVLKKLMSIDEKERDEIIKDDIFQTKRIYIARYREFKINQQTFLVK